MTIAGLPAFSWLEMFSLCHEASGDGRVTRVSWPDGGPPLEQEEVLVGAFLIMREQLLEVIEVRRKRG